MYYLIKPTNKDLQHHGVLGMKWGVRRYQPYSQVPRKSGEYGKEIGEAKKTFSDKIGLTAHKKVKDAKQKADKAYEEYEKVDKPNKRLREELVNKSEEYGVDSIYHKQLIDLISKEEPYYSNLQKANDAVFRAYQETYNTPIFKLKKKFGVKRIDNIIDFLTNSK